MPHGSDFLGTLLAGIGMLLMMGSIVVLSLLAAGMAAAVMWVGFKYTLSFFGVPLL